MELSKIPTVRGMTKTFENHCITVSYSCFLVFEASTYGKDDL